MEYDSVDIIDPVFETARVISCVRRLYATVKLHLQLIGAPWNIVCYTAVFSVVTRDDTKNGCVADYMK